MTAVLTELDRRLTEAGITLPQFADRIGIPAQTIYHTIGEGWGMIDPLMAAAFARYWGTTPEYWLGITHSQNIERARAIGDKMTFKVHEEHPQCNFVEIKIG